MKDLRNAQNYKFQPNKSGQKCYKTNTLLYFRYITPLLW